MEEEECLEVLDYILFDVLIRLRYSCKFIGKYLVAFLNAIYQMSTYIYRIIRDGRAKNFCIMLFIKVFVIQLRDRAL